MLRQSTDCTFLQEREQSSCDVIIILGFCLFFSFLNNDFRFLITIFCSFALFGFCITNGTRATWPWVPCVAPHYQFHMPVQLWDPPFCVKKKKFSFCLFCFNFFFFFFFCVAGNGFLFIIIMIFLFINFIIMILKRAFESIWWEKHLQLCIWSPMIDSNNTMLIENNN